LPISTKTLNGNDHITLLLFCFAIDPTSNITKPCKRNTKRRLDLRQDSPENTHGNHAQTHGTQKQPLFQQRSVCHTWDNTETDTKKETHRDRAEEWVTCRIVAQNFHFGVQLTGIQIQSCYTTHVEKQKTLEICARFLEQTLQPNPKRFWRQTETERQRETRDA
jgi:hypothetical protein